MDIWFSIEIELANAIFLMSIKQQTTICEVSSFKARNNVPCGGIKSQQIVH
jgi:hypothetical protein